MRQCQLRMALYTVAKDQQVDVERPWSEAHRWAASSRQLERFRDSEQLFRKEAAVTYERGVQIVGLWNARDRLGNKERCHPDGREVAGQEAHSLAELTLGSI